MTRVDSLRLRVWENETCGKLLEQAEILSKSLFDLSIGKKLFPPFYTDHGPNHCEKVEEILNKLIFGVTANGKAFNPTPEEAMYLLAAIWLHDIGMIYGIFPGENLEGEDVDWGQCRDRHEQRSANFILNVWDYNCNWSNSEKASLGQLCIHHRQAYALAEMEPVEVDGRTGKIRLRELAALLRIADACHIDETRVPVDLRNRFMAIGLPVDAKEHWGLPKLVHSISFDHNSKTIRLLCFVPRPDQFGTVTIDFQPVVDRLTESLRQELFTVVPFLSNYGNTCFKFVESKADHLQVMDSDKSLHEMWPCMLSMAITANSIASMVAAVLLAAVRRQTELPSHGIKEIIDRAVKVHPYNVLVRHLHAEMTTFIAQGVHPNIVERYLLEYGLRRQTACEEVAEQAKQKINPEDVLVLYGYSNVVMTLLTKYLRGHKKKILVVRCRRSIPGAALHDENQRIAEDLDKAGLTHEAIELASLQTLFPRFREKGIHAKVLLGARGVLNSHDVLAPVGTGIVAATAKTAGIEVLVLAEPEKVTSNPQLDFEMTSLLDARTTDWVSHVANDVPRPTDNSSAPEIDRLTLAMYDELVGTTQVAGTAT